MDNSSTIIDFLGKKDSVVDFKSKWPIFRLNVFDSNGLWIKFKNKLTILNNSRRLLDVNENKLFDYYMENPDIEFELFMFEQIMQKHHLFNVDGKVYSYSLGIKMKNTKNIAYVRFYFDIKDFFNL